MWGWMYMSVVEFFPNLHKSLGLITKRKKEKQPRGGTRAMWELSAIFGCSLPTSTS